MRFHSLSRVVLVVLLSVWLGRLATAATGYEADLARAQRLAGEASWAQAQEAYAAALVLAPDAEAQRRCELGRVDAGWRAADRSADTEALLARIAEFENLLERYQQPGAEKDAFWCAAMASWCDFRAAQGYWPGVVGKLLEEVDYRNDFNRRRRTGAPEQRVARFLDLGLSPDADRIAICETLAEQRPTPEARRRYLDAVRTLVADPERQWDRTVLGRSVDQVRQAARLAETADDRAWFALVAQMLSASQAEAMEVRAGQWREVLGMARGTQYETLAHGAEFCWRAASGWTPGLPAGTPVDLVARVQECDSLLRRLWPELHSDKSPDELDWATDGKAEEQIGGEKSGWVRPVVLALGKWREQWQAPRVELSLPSRVRPGEDIAGRFGATSVDKVEFALMRLTPEEWLAYTWFLRTGGRDGHEPKGELVRRWTVETALAAQLGFRSGPVELGTELAPGFYLLTAEGRAMGRTARESFRFLVSGVEVAVLAPYFRSAELYCIDAATRQPVADAVVMGGADVRFAAAPCIQLSGRTDSQGKAKLQFVDQVGASRSDNLAGWVGAQPFSIDWDGLLGREQGASLDGDVIFDREVYRPGETVRWKLVLREHQDGRFTMPPAGTKLKVSAAVGDTVLLKETELALNAFGTIAGEVALPETCGLGYGRLSFTLASDAERWIRTTGSSSSFRVEKYRPPATAVEVELAGPADSLRGGQEAVFRVRATYLSGGPMSGAEARCRITFEPADEPGAGRVDGGGRVDPPAVLPKPRDFAATTDRDGAVVFRCALPEDLPEGTLMMLKGSVLPAGMAEVEFRRTAFVTKSGYLCAPDSREEFQAVRPGAEAVFAAQVCTGDQRPAAGFCGTAQVVECRWNEVWRLPDGRIVTGEEAQRLPLDSLYGDEDAAGPECLHAGYQETVVAEMSVQADGQGKIEVRMAPPHAGLYRLRLAHDGTALFVPEAVRRLTIVCDEKVSELALPRKKTVVAVFGPVVNGAPLRVLVATPYAAAKGWLVVDGADRAVVQPFELAGRAGVLTVAQPPRFAGAGSVEVKLPPHRYGGGGTTFATERPDTELAITLAPAASESRPGRDARVRLQVTGGAPGALPAELCLNVVDEAVATLGRDSDWRRESAFARRHVPESRLSFPTESMGPSEEPRDGRAGIVSMASWPGRRLLGYEQMDALACFAGLDPHYASDSVKYARGLSAVFCDLGGKSKRLQTARLRTRFEPSAFWAPQVVTDPQGAAAVSFTYPDNLTQWRIEAYAVGVDGESFGTATAFTRTSLPFQARLNLPRFLVAGDRAAVPATLVNRTDGALAAKAELAVAGAATLSPKSAGIAVPAQGEAQLDWPVRAERAGTADFTLQAWAGAESDGMKLPLPVIEDGILQETAAAGRLGPAEQRGELVLDLPEPLDPERTTVRLQLSGSRAAALLGALPYLVDYPYGCVEQTLSRFLPAVVAKRTLGALGFEPAAVEARILGRETEADAARRLKTAGLGRLDEVIGRSLIRLGEAQRSDGGFGWWPGAAEGDLWMTAYAVWGLGLAGEAGVAVPRKLAEKASTALVSAMTESKFEWTSEAAAEARAWALAAVAGAPLAERETKRRAEAWRDAYQRRGVLTAAGRACLALAAAKLGTAEERAVLLRNLDNGAVRGANAPDGDTVHWGRTSGHRRAGDGAVETTALTLLALLELAPDHPLAEAAVNWLVLNRRAGHWESTRATAFAALALSRFMQVRGETLAEAEVEVLANGAAVARVRLDRATLLAGETEVVVPLAKLHAGKNRLGVRRIAGKGDVYAMVLAESWARGASIRPAGHQVSVARGFVRQTLMPTLSGAVRSEPVPLAEAGAVQLGEAVQVVVTLTVPEGLEYVMVEVPKPAGCEPLNPLSGRDAQIRRITGAVQPTVDGAHAIYREERDERSVFFLDHVEAGTWEIRYGMRAVTAGEFRVLPVQVEAMYVPEIRANSDARQLQVGTRESAE